MSSEGYNLIAILLGIPTFIILVVIAINDIKWEKLKKQFKEEVKKCIEFTRYK